MSDDEAHQLVCEIVIEALQLARGAGVPEELIASAFAAGMLDSSRRGELQHVRQLFYHVGDVLAPPEGSA